ncbi:MAG: redoxin family protein [Phycisphaerales bacterium]|nr:redoxin family protein [Phycisphaerales bacterium]
MFAQLILSPHVRLAVWIAAGSIFLLVAGTAPRGDDARGVERGPAGPTTVPTLPADRGGQDPVGRPLPPLDVDRWLPAEPGAPDRPAAGQVTLYRWWTDHCPFCAKSLPAFERLRERYAPHGLAVVGVFHPKPPRPTPDHVIRGRAAELGFRGMLAVDEDWSVLRAIAPTAGRRLPTSMSFLVDATGVVRFVHPGPVLFPSSDPDHGKENGDFLLLERAIRVLLELPEPTPVPRSPE